MLVPAAAILAYLVVLAGIVLWLPALVLVRLVTAPFDPNRRAAGRFLRWLAVLATHSFPFWRIRIEGKFPADRRAYVVVSNHQSMLDIFMLSRIPREMKWMAKAELFRIPWVGWMFRIAGDIPVRRGDAASGRRALERAAAYLRSGMHVMLFPEGTRSRDGKLLPFKPGAFKLAISAGAPVLPVALDGAGAGMPKGSPWVRPARAWARILEPVETSGMTEDDVDRLADVVRARIGAELPGGGSATRPAA
ncbi:MAG TPA: lysophospholipid acyltransferase family protein [Anaeromyxobacteraceae bacterium]|jgi:1-acyl-sn-glycerol-3-phosphate acyltransferase